MRGYGRDEMYGEDLDEDEEAEEYEEEEEEEEEEDPKPTMEELKYLELRQQLKDIKRKELNKENGATTGNSLERKKKLPYDNYGSFFGPSQPVIAARVIQESKSLLETQHLAARASNSHHGLQGRKPVASSTVGSRPGVHGPPSKVIDMGKSKGQKLKDMRDYSFLNDEDAELPAPAKEEPPLRNTFAPNYARSAQVPSKNKQSTSNPRRPVSSGGEDRKSVPMNRQLQSKSGPQKVVPTSSPGLSTTDPRRQLGSNTGNGPGRPMVSKGLTPKRPGPTKLPTSLKTQAPILNKKASSMGIQRPVTDVQRAPSSKLHSSASKQHLNQRREFREPEKARQVSKQLISSSKPEMKPPKQMAPRPSVHANRPKKRPVEQYSDDEENYSLEIRKMFRYNPRKYAGDDEDDSDMEANFEDIQREELHSARIAREEDEREARLIEEEEKRERMRKEAKRRKLSQR